MDALSRDIESEDSRTPEELGARHGINEHRPQESDVASLAHGSAHANAAARVVCGRVFRRRGAFAPSAFQHATTPEPSQQGVMTGPSCRCKYNYTGVRARAGQLAEFAPPTQVFPKPIAIHDITPIATAILAQHPSAPDPRN